MVQQEKELTDNILGVVSGLSRDKEIIGIIHVICNAPLLHSKRYSTVKMYIIKHDIQ